MLGLIFPLLVLLLVLGILIFVLKKSYWSLLFLLVLLAGWQQLSVLVGLNFTKQNDKILVSAEKKAVRILSWNVSRWDERNKEKRGGVSFRPLMLDFIKMQDADILCFQEFFECHDPKYGQATLQPIKNMGYPYHVFYPSSQMFEGAFQFGLCIFSKFPIIDSGRFHNYKGEHSEGLLFADVLIHQQKIRVYTTHLESPGFTGGDYNSNGTAKASRTVLSKLKHSYSLRNLQASFVRSEIDKSPYPVIVTADLNDVPNSYAYFKVKQGMHDSFLKLGFGLGKTFRFVSPTLRIDYIFTDKRLNPLSFSIEDLPYSDHYPLTAEIALSSD
jgi:endonuclease/exonuclease/phosphatase family metal-dependent hydrolase